MEKKIIPAEAGMRLDQFLANKFPEYSRTYFQKLINKNLVLVNGFLRESSYRLHSGESIEINFLPKEEEWVQPEAIPLEIIFEDKDIIVVNKPAGMVVHPACGHKSGTLVNALLSHFQNLPSLAGGLRAGLVHRLDKGTSGVMVIAKNEKALFFLAKQFAKRRVEKTYLALVHGCPKEKKGIIEAPLGRDLKNRKKVTITSFRSRQAVTEFKVMESFKELTLLEVKPYTGRTHQIRVHLSAIGHPVCGDKEYYGRDAYPRPLLHSWKLKFIHPGKKEWIEFTASLPEDFSEILETLRINK